MDKILGLSSPQQGQKKSSYQRVSADTNVEPSNSIDKNSLDLYLWVNQNHLAYSAARTNKETLHQRICMTAITFSTAPCFVESTIFRVLIDLEELLIFIVNCVLN
jgi:hypothetical protein